MRQSDKGYGEEEVQVRELTEADLANIYGGAKGGHNSSGTTGMPDLSGLHLPYGMSMPNLSNLSGAVPSSPSGSNAPAGNSVPTGKGTPDGGGSTPGLGSLLGFLPALPSI